MISDEDMIARLSKRIEELTAEIERCDVALFAQVRENRALTASLFELRTQNENLLNMTQEQFASDREVQHRRDLAQVRKTVEEEVRDRHEHMKRYIECLKYELKKLQARFETAQRRIAKLKKVKS